VQLPEIIAAPIRFVIGLRHPCSLYRYHRKWFRRTFIPAYRGVRIREVGL